MALGTGLAGWGGLTRVRRRAAIGAGGVLLAVLLLLAEPIARARPDLHGIAVWIALAAIGTAIIVAAALLERGRAKVAAAVRKLGELTTGWE